MALAAATRQEPLLSSTAAIGLTGRKVPITRAERFGTPTMPMFCFTRPKVSRARSWATIRSDTRSLVSTMSAVSRARSLPEANEIDTSA